jgi:general secretion pathway protein I
MVAFVVMGLVVGVILQLFGSSMNSVALSDEYSFAVQVAESRLAAVGNEIKVEDGSVSGEEKGSAYRWDVHMAPIELSDKLKDLPLPLNMYKVEVVVTWKSGDKPREFHLSSLRFGEDK